MKRITKKAMLLSFALGLCMSMGAGVSALPVSGEGENVNASEFYAYSISLREPSGEYGAGVNFKIVMSEEKYNEYVANVADKTVTTGVLLAPTATLGGAAISPTNTQKNLTEITWTDVAIGGVAYKQASVFVYDIDKEYYDASITIGAYVTHDDTLVYEADSATTTVAWAANQAFAGVSEENQAAFKDTYLTYDYAIYTTSTEEAAETGTIVYGEKLTEPTVEGELVLGWKNKAGTKDWDFANAVEGDISVYANLHEFTGAGTETDPYQIDETNDLLLLDYRVSAGNSYEGSYFKVMNDIDMSAVSEFTSIGVASGNYDAYTTIVKAGFAGTFDGNDKTVTLNLTDGKSFTGMFSAITSTATVKNLTVAGNVTGGTYDVGAVVAYNDGGTVYNCTNTATLASTSSSAPFHYGGIVGFSYDGTIENCTNLAEINIENGHTIGGIVGRVGYGTLVKNCVNGSSEQEMQIEAAYELGGIVGFIGTTSIEGCKNYMAIVSTSTSTGKTSGIVGTISGETTINGCENYGNITCKSKYVGGIAGYIVHESVDIMNCDNYGDISSTVQGAGGIVGLYNKAGTYTIENCHNHSEKITAPKEAGGVIGRVGNFAMTLTVKDCSSNESYLKADVIGSFGANATITLEGLNTEA